MNKKIGNVQQLCSVRRVVATEGKEAGMKLIEISNGVLNLTLLESCALDIYQLFHKGMNMSFISRNGMVKDDVPFLNYFPAGMLYTCGLDAIGAVGDLPMHGSLHHTPAVVKSIECTEDGIKINAEIRSTALFGKCLVIDRTVSLKAGESAVRIHDELINDNFRDEDYALLYHINIGYPMLDVGAELRGDIMRTVPRDKAAYDLIDRCFVADEPVDNKGEACYFHSLRKPELSVTNRNIGKKFTVRYSGDSLPELIEWKGLASGDFVIGIEPSTTKLDKVDFKKIPAGGKECFDIELYISEI